MHNTHVLIVDDNATILQDLEMMIQDIGYVISGMATSYRSAIDIIKSNMPDIILLDIDLCSIKDGIDIGSYIRNISNLPIIYLTGHNDKNTVQRAYFTKPITYINKPFTYNDIKTALFLASAELDKQSISSPDIKIFDSSYRYNKKNKTLFYQNDDFPIHLSPKEKLLLEVLINAEGKAVNFYSLEQLLWEGESVSNATLRTLVGRLRKKTDARFIETIPAFGYRVII